MAYWGFIGCGNLAQAIISGAISEKIISPNNIAAFDKDVKKLQKFSRDTRIGISVSLRDLVNRADVIVLGTKPQDILPVLEELSAKTLAGQPSITGKTVISLAAGVPSTLLLRYLSTTRTLVRVMANTAATVQKGLFGIYFIQKAHFDQSEVLRFFGGLGQVTLLDTDLKVNAITSGSASGIGFVFSFMEEFEKWFLKKGFSKIEARKIAVETFFGAACLAKTQEGTTIDQLRKAVSSKRGTTLAGLTAMKKAGVGSGLRSGLDAGYTRGAEIAKSLLRHQK